MDTSKRTVNKTEERGEVSTYNVNEMVFFASNNSKKLHPKMEKVASPFWRKLQAARQGCQSAAQTALQTYH